MPDLGEDNLRLMALSRRGPLGDRTILESGQEEVTRLVQGLQEGDQAAVAATLSDHDGDGKLDVGVGVAIDAGHGLKVGAEFTKSESAGWGWFTGAMWRFGRKK